MVQTRRRSEVALPRFFGGSGSPSLHISSSMVSLNSLPFVPHGFNSALFQLSLNFYSFDFVCKKTCRKAALIFLFSCFYNGQVGFSLIFYFLTQWKEKKAFFVLSLCTHCLQLYCCAVSNCNASVCPPIRKQDVTANPFPVAWQIKLLGIIRVVYSLCHQGVLVNIAKLQQRFGWKIAISHRTLTWGSFT